MARFSISVGLLSRLLCIALIAITTGCASVRQPAEFTIVKTGYMPDLDAVLVDEERLHKRDPFGRTLLHQAVLSSSRMIEPLINAGIDVNVTDKRGMTPLHLAVLNRPDSISRLLPFNPDFNLASTKSIACTARKRSKIGLTVNQLIEFCGLNRAAGIVASYRSDQALWQQARLKDSYESYQKYLDNMPRGSYRETALERQELALENLEKTLEQNETCPITDSEYYLLTDSCKDGLAHGPGEAKTPLGKRFVGTFHHGDMHHGKMYAEGTLVWDGPIVEGIPHGKGVCRYNEEMEVCETYEGKRIDVLFKQRLLMVQQMEMMQAQMDGLRRDVRASSYQTAQSSDVDSEYLVDLFSDDKNKRTVAQVRAAVDLFSFLIKNTREKK
ncbi:MAG: ankyrin repeat domain-containing protein [Saccharospirillaceae bacterium]|nr:ankyrin repeat domain-containing protein [Saccharospirillaceae bacterium]